MDTHTPLSIALGSARVALRVFLAQRPDRPFPGSSESVPAPQAYDAIFWAAASEMLRIHAATRSETEAVRLDPALGPVVSNLASEVADIARNAAAEVSEYQGGGLAPTVIAISAIASSTASLAAEAAKAYETARKAVLP